MADSNVLKEFLVSLSFKIREDEARRFFDTVEKSTKGALAFGAAVGAMGVAAVAAIEKVARGFESLYYASQRTSTSIAHIEAFKYAVSQLGGTAAEAQQDLESFARHLRDAPGFEKLLKARGVATRDASGNLRETVDLIREFDAALIKSNTPYATRLQYEEKLFGVHENTLLALPKLKEFYDEENRRLRAFGLDSKEAGENAVKFEQSMRALGATVDAIWKSAAAQFFKDYGDDIKAFGKYLEAHHEEISKAISHIAGAVLHMTKWLVDHLPILDKTITSTIGWEKALTALGAVILLTVFRA